MSVESRPKISVIIPAYRVTEYIAEALDSVLAQTFTDYEIVVVNDGCPDTAALESVLAPYLDKIVYLKQENSGLAAARNTAIRAARGEFIALLDSDDAWEPDYLALQLAALEADPSASVVYPNGVVIGDSPQAGRLLMDLSPSEGPADFEGIVRLRCQVVVSVLARREAVVRAGLFDPELRAVEDFDLWLRMALGGHKFIYHRKPLFRYRRRGDSLSSNSVWMRQCAMRVLEKIEREFNLNARDRAALEAGKIRFQADIEYFKGREALAKGDVRGAIRGFSSANRQWRLRGLAMKIRMLRLFPKITLALARWRDTVPSSRPPK